ncbi:UUP1 family membrane protein [Fangia hongkongensis]|uniref:UUP1 family membrane protein n=2 Tax=Fangia hongkongensis TaxID=270495 RepID=UPI0019074E1C|nr:UUP1 family membrane protein [Fangia hongkongensis]MBK2124582.1 UUP1 family membrane protein [Fangia hongkongensis]
MSHQIMNKINRQFYTLFVILMITGVGITLYQHYKLGLDWQPDAQKAVWKFNAELDIAPTVIGNTMRVNLFVPNLEAEDALHESISAAGFGKIIMRSEDKQNKVAVLSKSEVKSRQTILYDITVPSGAKFVEPPVPNLKKAKEKITHHYKAKERITLLNAAKEIAEKSSDEQTMIKHSIRFVNSGKSQNFWQLLIQQSPSNQQKVRVLGDILTTLNLPNTILHVVPYDSAEKLSLRTLPTWIAVFYQSKWHIFDTKTDALITNPDQKAFIWWLGNENFIKINGGDLRSSSFTATKQGISQERYLMLKNSALKQNLYEFSLLNLPAQTQEIYKIILMVPVGVLIILFLRILIGVPTLGTFMPVLIALAFKDTSLVWGIILFSFVVLVGLSFRAYFEKLQLLVVPRLGMILTIVVILMALISIIMHKMELSQGLSITLFPMVILTMSIERLSIIWDEKSGTEAIKIAIGSLFAATVCYMFIFNEILEYWFFTFPGLLLIVMAIMLLIGRYRGYRLSELYRFNALMKKNNKKSS